MTRQRAAAGEDAVTDTGRDPDSGGGVDAVYARIRARLPALVDELRLLLGPGWTVVAQPGERSHPHLALRGPAGGGGRRVEAEISPVRCRAAAFHATVGISMAPQDLDPAPLGDPGAAAPAWVARLRALGEAAERWTAPTGPRPGLVRVSDRPAGGVTGPARAKLELADRFGLPRRWAKGWPERLLGLRTEPVPGERFDGFAREVAALCRRLEAGPAGPVGD